MKNLIITLLLGLAFSFGGCTALKQSSHTHSAIEAQNYDVDKVVIKVVNGHKTVIVHTVQKVNSAGVAEIKEIAQKEVPEAEKVKVVQPR